MTTPSPRPVPKGQHALLYVTGWLCVDGSRLRIDRVPITWHPDLDALTGQRVTAVLECRTNDYGRIMGSRMVRVRAAGSRQRNKLMWSAMGRLWRLDTSDHLLKLRLLSRTHGQLGHPVNLRMSQRLMYEVQDHWEYVHVSGSVIDGMLLADAVRDGQGPATPPQLLTPLSPPTEVPSSLLDQPTPRKFPSFLLGEIGAVTFTDPLAREFWKSARADALEDAQRLEQVVRDRETTGALADLLAFHAQALSWARVAGEVTLAHALSALPSALLRQIGELREVPEPLEITS